MLHQLGLADRLSDQALPEPRLLLWLVAVWAAFANVAARATQNSAVQEQLAR